MLHTLDHSLNQGVIVMTSDQLLKMIGGWELKTNEEFAEEFGLSVRTIQRYAKMAREADSRFCQRRNM